MTIVRDNSESRRSAFAVCPRTDWACPPRTSPEFYLWPPDPQQLFAYGQEDRLLLPPLPSFAADTPIGSCGWIVLKNSATDARRMDIRPAMAHRVIGVSPLAGGDCLRSGDELGQLAEVLGDGGEVEFVAGATRAAQP